MKRKMNADLTPGMKYLKTFLNDIDTAGDSTVVNICLLSLHQMVTNKPYNAMT